MWTIYRNSLSNIRSKYRISRCQKWSNTKKKKLNYKILDTIFFFNFHFFFNILSNIFFILTQSKTWIYDGQRKRRILSTHKPLQHGSDQKHGIVACRIQYQVYWSWKLLASALGWITQGTKRPLRQNWCSRRTTWSRWPGKTNESTVTVAWTFQSLGEF
jgi:hypothetical protein